MKHNTFLVKPASSLCSLRCRYCFYGDVSSSRSCKSMGLMTRETARELIEKAFAATEDGGSIHFLFQGGEPTLAGLDFFRFFLETEQAQHRRVQVSHSIQTNGICLDEAWAVFFREHGFLVGLSLDGTREHHDLYRLTPAGEGTWETVTRSLALLDRAGVETDLLCVVTGQLAKKPQRAFRSLCSLGQHNLQFIPCLDPLDSDGGQAYSLTADQYGRFLCGVFDVWYQQLQQGRYVSVRSLSLPRPLPGRLQAGLGPDRRQPALRCLPAVLRLCAAPAAGGGPAALPVRKLHRSAKRFSRRRCLRENSFSGEISRPAGVQRPGRRGHFFCGGRTEWPS